MEKGQTQNIQNIKDTEKPEWGRKWEEAGKIPVQTQVCTVVSIGGDLDRQVAGNTAGLGVA
jgi:hypothetical protein